MMKDNVTFFPSIVNLELTNRCNLECVFCDWPQLKDNMVLRQMDQSLLVNILQQCRERNVYELGLVGLGEPLLVRDLAPYLDTIDCFRTQFQRISLNTNGIALSPDNAHIICLSSVNHITISLNATSPAMYRKLMKRDCFHRVVENLKILMVIREELKRDDLNIHLQAAAVDGNDHTQLEELFRDEIQKGLVLFSRHMYNKPVLETQEQKDRFVSSPTQERRYPCWSIFSRVYIDVEGNLYPCTIGNDCYRSNSTLNLGNVGENTIEALFNGPQITQARTRAFTGHIPFEECKICNIWSLLPNNFQWDQEARIWCQKSDQLRLQELQRKSST